MTVDVDLERFRLNERHTLSKPKEPTTRQSEPFIRGPIPLWWIARAATIPRRNALIVGIVLWWLAGMRSGHSDLVLTVRRCKLFGLGRKGVARGLRNLEEANLIRVSRKKGKAARVDLIVNPETRADTQCPVN
jgi:hypothetical protein